MKRVLLVTALASLGVTTLFAGAHSSDITVSTPCIKLPDAQYPYLDYRRDPMPSTHGGTWYYLGIPVGHAPTEDALCILPITTK